MAQTYDKHYQTENLFGEPYPELVDFFESQTKRGKLLDMGCGQGRDAIALARLGYSVTGIDTSTVGIRQMLKKAESEGLHVTGIVEDIYNFRDYANFDFILLDSMLHFGQPELEQETELVRGVIHEAKPGAVLVFCIQDTGNKIASFDGIMEKLEIKERSEQNLRYAFVDRESGHVSETAYKMIVIVK